MTTDPADLDNQPPAISDDPPPRVGRIVALIEVLICSDFPTQVALGSTFAAFGVAPYVSSGRLSVAYVVGLSLADTAALIALIFLFLYTHGERPRNVLIGRRPIAPEISAGVPLIAAAFAIGIAVLLVIHQVAPSLHTVENNPLQELLQSPRDAWLFALVVVVAGGVREEIQRAFLLHRFEVWLGGGSAGVIITSAAFGLGHLMQGLDATLATATLGAFWGAIYLRRRSCIAPMVSHSGFDLLQIAQYMAFGR